MKINKFKKLSNNKYKIFFDNESLIVYEDVIIKYNLLYKKEIDNDLLLEINKDNYKASIYDTALKYIGVRMRSEKEIREYLSKKNYDEKDIKEVMNKLKYQGLLDDVSFSKSYINDKLYLTNSGPNKIKMELEKLGVSEDVINDSANNIDKKMVLEKLEKIINKEVRLNAKLPISKLNNKIINRCMSLGYNYEDIIEILSNVDVTSKSDINKDYEKLYKKYSLKYDDYKLKSYIKSKLYQKGYNLDEINRVVGE